MERNRSAIGRQTAAWFAVALLSGLACSACASTGAGVTARRADDATAASATDPSIPLETVDTPVPTTEPATTEPPATDQVTVPPTEAVTTTTAPPGVPGGWRHVDVFPNEVFPPFDESNWTGVPSPPITTPLADGIYSASVLNPWTASSPNTLDIVLQALVPCTSLPADSCLDTGEPFGPNELGLSADLVPMTIPLDATIGVGLTGFDCEPVDALGNGADMAALLAAFDAAYATTIAPALNGPTDIVGALNSSPSNGFSGLGGACGPDGFSLVYHFGDAPPLLLQTVGYPGIDANGNSTGRIPLTPTDVIHLDTVQVSDGVMTFYFYAGFYS